jgi:hypothetical protein
MFHKLPLDWSRAFSFCLSAKFWVEPNRNLSRAQGSKAQYRCARQKSSDSGSHRFGTPGEVDLLNKMEKLGCPYDISFARQAI